MIGYWLLLAHLFGDYVLQSDWMANEKTKGHGPALAHALTYTVPFMFLTGSLKALIFIAVTHFIIDRYRLAKYVCWAKNWIGPKSWRHPWAECQPTGYHKDKPMWLTMWLMFITDNALHILCNGIAFSLWVL